MKISDRIRSITKDSTPIQPMEHYDLLIDENNDPFRDPPALQSYMDKWDGQQFLNALQLNQSLTVLEIGIGTGRLAAKTAPLCRELTGIDLSAKTVERAKENLSQYQNIRLLCGDFCTHPFGQSYDIIYSSLTWFHIKEKQQAMNRIETLLKTGGRFILSIDRNPTPLIEYGTRSIRIYPDSPEQIAEQANRAGLTARTVSETEFAYILSVEKTTA